MPGARRNSAFTLIELLAVVLIFGLLAGVALPNFGVRSAKMLEDEAKQMAGNLEFVRQRAVMTGVPHRIVLDVEYDRYWIEWYVSEARARGEEEVIAEAPAGDLAVAMSPMRGGERAFRRLMGSLGNESYLRDEVFVEGVDTPQGFFKQGEVRLEFSGDGTTDPASIRLSDADGRRITLEVAPLLDTVRFAYDDA